MGAIYTQVRSVLRRRRAQFVIIAFISLMAAAVSTLSLTLLLRDNQPFDDAFAAVNGPHLIFHVDASRVTREQLAATASLPGVTAAGPARESATVTFQRGALSGSIQVIDRDNPGGSFDRLALLAGRWPARDDEIAVGKGDPGNSSLVPRLGDSIQAVTPSQTITFKVVGEVSDLAAFNNQGAVIRAWVLDGRLAKILEGSEIPLRYEMPYRFQNAATDADIAADRKIIESALPNGAAVQPPTTWLDMRAGFNWLVTAVGGIIFAFSTFALIAVVLVVASVVAGTVVAGYREFGIAKALGFTPAEVVAIVTGQMVAPAIVGSILGVPLGALASMYFLAGTSVDLMLPMPSPIDPLIDLGVLLGVVVLVALAALLPALQAARANPIRAIALGAAPRASRHSFLGSLLLRLGATPAVSLGAGEAFARPVRASLTVVALGIGIATLTFAFTFGPTLQRFVDEPASYGAAQDVNVVRHGKLSDPEAIALINGEPATRAVVASRQLPASVNGRANAEPLIAMRGDAPAFGYKAVSGRWYSGAGETVAGALIAKEMRLHVGDTVKLNVSGKDLSLRVVGLTNDVTTAGHGFRVDWQTLISVLPAESPDLYMVQLRNGGNVAAYTSSLGSKSPLLGAQSVPYKEYAQPFVGIVNGLIGGMTVVLALIAIAGVFNATLLMTRERVHDIATLKSLGMTPAQIAVMAASSSCVVAVVAALVGIPAGMWLLGMISSAMGDLYGFLMDTSASLNPVTAALVIIGAFVVALAGAALPARWAAATPVAQVLRSE